MGTSNHPIVIVMIIAVLSAVLAEIRIGVRIPAVLWEMVFGMLIGPHILAMARPDALLDWFGNKLGLAALFFMAGMDLDLYRVRGRPLALAFRGWVLSFSIGFGIAVVLRAVPFFHPPIIVALVLSTTALGTFMPALRDAERIETSFGNLVVAAGAAGEFAPVVAISLLVTREFSTWVSVAFMLMFVALAFGAAFIAIGFRPPKVLNLLSRTMHSSTQLPVCLSILILALFDVASSAIGFEAVLGAFSAGLVVGLASRGDVGKPFRAKMDAICFGFLVPFFFVVSGMNLDLGALVHNTKTMLLVPLFLVLFFVVRGAPVFLYRADLVKHERLPFALYSATTLTMVVAITTIGVRTGRMSTDVASALVGAGSLTVLLFPAIAGALLAKRSGSAHGAA